MLQDVDNSLLERSNILGRIRSFRKGESFEVSSRQSSVNLSPCSNSTDVGVNLEENSFGLAAVQEDREEHDRSKIQNSNEQNEVPTIPMEVEHGKKNSGDNGAMLPSRNKNNTVETDAVSASISTTPLSSASNVVKESVPGSGLRKSVTMSHSLSRRVSAGTSCTII